jgi:hypothetical protein
MNDIELLTLLKQAKSEAYLGPQGFKVFVDKKTFKKAQIGYSVDKNGSNITVNKLGSWQKSWCVIAQDTELGDPYFIDFDDKQLNVFTAVFNDEVNQWQSTLVATSLQGFIECINLLHEFTQQSKAQLIPDSSSIFDLETLEKFGMQLAEISENTDFWKSFFIGYIHWLHDEVV